MRDAPWSLLPRFAAVAALILAPLVLAGPLGYPGSPAAVTLAAAFALIMALQARGRALAIGLALLVLAGCLGRFAAYQGLSTTVLWLVLAAALAGLAARSGHARLARHLVIVSLIGTAFPADGQASLTTSLSLALGVAPGYGARQLLPQGPQPAAITLPWTITCRYTAALSFGMVICALLAQTIGSAHNQWLVAAFVVVIDPDLNDTWRTVIKRLTGTLFGALAATAVLAAHPTPVVLLGLIYAALVALFLVMRRSYPAMVGLLTLIIILLAWLHHPPEALIWSGAVERLALTLLGGALALLVVYTVRRLWPVEANSNGPT